ncbi:DUF1178 family protein [Bosea sp. (in: a-proteobacteria)]|uniref:DUF1178 family protein n=1 Tax=Bosea sp. (in: a-proteobacteria) TaxID=1871050 RepID=UPI001214EAAE|nr:DUF1178 family protein [Bosea sp. (in: a-proteobacteria)]TAJ28719.1 MAG: DUF1178 family protein [Bosea sp. (in: a-proteobacteria)]
MIRYTLVCDAAHEFDSWFSTSASFEEQAKRGLVACPVCGSTRVERAIMAPNVARTDLGPRRPQPLPVPAAPAAVSAPAPAAPPSPTALIGEKEAALRAMIAELHRQVRENAEHVGERFAEEALKIHHGETPERAIYGQASMDDAQMLQEEGVAFMPLPRLPGSAH